MRYRAEIDGLRAVAVIPVILFHAGLAGCSGGFVGVDVFFVISGYLITSIILQDVDAGRFSLARFYERRARRILPALFVVMGSCLPLAWRWLSPYHLRDFLESVGAVTLFGSNILFWRESGYFATAAELKPLLHTWSLAVEEQYYFIYPLFLLSVLRLGRRAALVSLMGIAALSLAFAQLGGLIDPSATFYLLPTRGWELLVGAATGFLLSGTPRADTRPFERPRVQQLGSLLGLLLIGASIVTYDAGTPFPGVYALAPTIGAALVILCASPETLVGRALGQPPLVFLGLISYSAYLWHQPLFAFARHRSLGEPAPRTLALLSVLSLVLAAMTWRWVETPFRRKDVVPTRTLVRLSFAFSAAFLSIAVAGHVAQGFPERMPASVRPLLAMRERYKAQRREGGCLIDRDATTLGDCVRGDRRGRRRYFLVGDSHAAALARELARQLAPRDVALVQHTKDSCPLAIDFVGVSSASCAVYDEALMKRIRDDDPDAIIVSSRWSYYLSDDDYFNGVGGRETRPRENHFSVRGVPSSAPSSERRAFMVQAYRNALQRLIATGKTVVLVYPVPEQGWDVPAVMAKASLWADFHGEDLAVPTSVVDRRHAYVVEAFDGLGSRPNLIRIRPRSILCGTLVTAGCAAQIKGTPLYYDDNHLSDAGAALVVRPIVDSLERKGAS